MRKVLQCHVGIGSEVKGIALVANDNFSARYDLDRVRGIFSRPQHKLYGQSYKDVILVLNTAKGGVATAWMLYEMSSRKIAPKALILNSINTILAQGAALAKMAIVDRFEEGDVTKLIKTGDELTVQPSLGRVVLINSL
ncbi:MAG: aconitase X swivel domain-containing protein [Paracoccaceae bacterium]